MVAQIGRVGHLKHRHEEDTGNGQSNNARLAVFGPKIRLCAR